MDVSTKKTNLNPMQYANPLSILFFTHTISMFKKGYYKTLEAADIYSPLKTDESHVMGDRLQKNWNKHVRFLKGTDKKPSLARVLATTFWPEYLLLAIMLGILELGFRIGEPIFLGKFLQYFRPDSSMTKIEALYNGIALVICNAGIAIMLNHYMFRALHYGMRMRTAVCSMIYRKALKLSSTALGDTASGKIVNLLTNDVSRFDYLSLCLHYLWAEPVCACIVVYCLWSEAGYAGLIGVVPFVAIVPFQSYVGRLSARFRRQTAYKTDERVRLMDEIISGIQVIKMYAWEKPFEKLIQISRANELKKIIKLSYIRGIYMSFGMLTARLSLFSAILTMVLSEQPIKPATIFAFTAYFHLLTLTMDSTFPRAISEVSEGFVSIKRLEEFLLNDECKGTISKSCESTITTDIEKETNETLALKLKEVTAKWNPSKPELAIKDIILTVSRGTLVAIIGSVGAGKSSLLQTIAGELDVVKGDIFINGRLSYASQDPWLFAASIKQNILFGSEYDSKRYKEVTNVCALKDDFEQFEHGDETIVADRGASLSGGQKARINLARAVYRQADIYILDDPLSAVDVRVGRHIFTQCIEGFLKDKTRILVTHQVQYLKEVEQIVILNDGVIESVGSFQALRNNNKHLEELVIKEKEVTDNKEQNSIKLISKSKISSVQSLQNISSEKEDREQNEEQKPMLEESSKDKVKGSLFLIYARAAERSMLMIIVVLLFVLAQFIASSVDYFVGFWTDLEEKRVAISIQNNTIHMDNNGFLYHLSTQNCLYVYTGLILTLAVTAFSRATLFYKLANICSQKLHDNMFKSLIYTSMRFFDKNPSGRILNRYSKDIGSVDELLPKAILDCVQLMLMMFGSLILIAVVNPALLIPLAGMTLVFHFMKVVYLKSSTNIKRLEGTMKSPVFTHLNASIQGLSTIRVFEAQAILTREFDKHQDLHTGAWFMYIAATTAFGFYLDALFLFFLICVTFSFLILEDSLGGQVGLAITQAAAMTGYVQFGIRQNSEVINQLMSVERIAEYSHLEVEKQPLVPRTPSANWPEFGNIQCKQASLRYSAELEPALKNLNVEIHSNAKIGIVGRTGAGKSSMIAAILRLAMMEGDIEIDGVNTETITLQTLRSKISIIPQDPVLFSGTLRYNLDPFKEYPDDVLYKALEDVELKDSAKVINQLDHVVKDRGFNYSVGQRQLICLARAIIRKNKILMLDEATANVDSQTDALIQKTIRSKFADCTVLTVAHRLNTIMDSDKVMVMDKGTIAEFGHPYTLLCYNEGLFYQMVQGTGVQMAEELTNIAKDSYNKTNVRTTIKEQII